MQFQFSCCDFTKLVTFDVCISSRHNSTCTSGFPPTFSTQSRAAYGLARVNGEHRTIAEKKCVRGNSNFRGLLSIQWKVVSVIAFVMQ